MLLSMLHHRVQTLLELSQCRSLLYHIHIVEAIVRDVALGHELKSGIHLVFRPRDRIVRIVPGEVLRTSTKLIATLCAQGMPISHGEAQMLLQGLAQNHLVLVIEMECQRIL